MSRKAVDAVFQRLFLLIDIRGILRESAPHHHISEEQKTNVTKTLDAIEKQVRILREELLK